MQSDQADVLLSLDQEVPVQLAVEGGINFGVWYPYMSNAGVPPVSSFTARGINITFIQGDLDADEIAKYDVIFIGRAGAIGRFPSGAGTLDIDALISFVNNGGGLIGESNATIFDSDNWRGVPWSSRLSVVQGISGDQSGYDYAEYDLPVSISNLTHPIVQGVASSFILSGSHASKNSARLDTTKNPAALLVGTVNGASIVAADSGNGCSVYFPAAVGFGGMDWSANPDYETLFLNAVEYAGTCGVIPVAIDIKPGSDENSINLCSNGAVPVAILGSNTFDVNDINPDSLRLADAAVKVVGKKDPKTLCSIEDVNDDSYDDLVCHFNTTELSNILDGTSTSATVKGETVDGTPIEGSDNITIVKDECE